MRSPRTQHLGRGYRRSNSNLRGRAPHRRTNPWRFPRLPFDWFHNGHGWRTSRAAIPALAHDCRATRIPKCRCRTPLETFPTRGRSAAWLPAGRVDIRSSRAEERLFQSCAAGRGCAPLYSELLWPHRESTPRWPSHRPPCRRVVARLQPREFGARREIAECLICRAHRGPVGYW